MALLLVILVPLAALVIYAIAFDLSERLINRAVGQMARRGIGRPGRRWAVCRPFGLLQHTAVVS